MFLKKKKIIFLIAYPFFHVLVSAFFVISSFAASSRFLDGPFPIPRSYMIFHNVFWMIGAVLIYPSKLLDPFNWSSSVPYLGWFFELLNGFLYAILFIIIFEVYKKYIARRIH